MFRNRQEFVLQWVKDTFGAKALNRKERAARLVEETLELAQACGLSLDDVARIGNRVYDRAAGQCAREIGSVQITLEALAELLGYKVDLLADEELFRVLQLPARHFVDSDAEKRRVGILFYPPD